MQFRGQSNIIEPVLYNIPIGQQHNMGIFNYAVKKYILYIYLFVIYKIFTSVNRLVWKVGNLDMFAVAAHKIKLTTFLTK